MGDGAVDGAGYVAFAPVVGGKGERPVAKQPIEVLQVVERGVGGGVYVVSPVVERGLFQPVVPPCGGHELPQARCADVRTRFGYIRAFNKRQQRHFGGHIAFFDFVGDVVHIGGAALDGAVEIGAVLGEFAFVAAHEP